MTISYREFLKSILLGAKLMDESLPHLKIEQYVWESWAFSDSDENGEGGVHYISPDERGKPNTFKFRPEGVTLQ